VPDRVFNYWLRSPQGALQVTPEQAQMVVLEGNIGRFSLVLRQLIKTIPLQTRRTGYDDLPPAMTALFSL
jgi:Flp pilus assembly protein CpaB